MRLSNSVTSSWLRIRAHLLDSAQWTVGRGAVGKMDRGLGVLSKIIISGSGGMSWNVFFTLPHVSVCVFYANLLPAGAELSSK
ncbi:hypothetical protein NL676_032433 [Syzygium grande]|nr:hypothetical protein NL676_032433 [Syzygium grande]